MSIATPAVYLTDTRIIYRASSLGHCFRRLVAARMNFQPAPIPANLQKAFDEGNAKEEIILATMEMSDPPWQLWDKQGLVELHVGTNHEGKELYVVGHYDALGQRFDDNHSMPVDVKAFAPSTIAKWKDQGFAGFPYYAFQQSVYAIGTGSTQFAMPIYNKETGELDIEVHDTIPVDYEQIQEKVFQVEEAIENSLAVANIPCTDEYGCPYFYLHDAKDLSVIPDEALDAVTAYTNVKKKIDMYEKVRSVLRDQLLELLPYDDQHKTFSNHDMSITVAKNPRRLDMDAIKELLKAADVDIKDYYLEGSGVNLRIKMKDS